MLLSRVGSRLSAASILVLCPLCYASEAAELLLTRVDGAKCLDGSPAGYYYGKPSSGASNTWVFHIQGGGACMGGDCRIWVRMQGSSTDSSRRDGTGRGGYVKLPFTDPPEFEEVGGLGFGPWPEKTSHFVNDHDVYGPWPGDAANSPPTTLSNDATVNPRFHDAHHVWIPYCSGDNWMATLDEEHLAHGFIAANVCKTPVCAMQGHTNLLRIFADILALTEIKSATNVLLAGASAGGHGGVFGHCDWLAGEVSKVASGAVTKCNPISGYYFPSMVSASHDDHTKREYYSPPETFGGFVANYPPDAQYAAQMDPMAKLIEMFGLSLPDGCVNGLKSVNVTGSLCFSAGAIFAFTKTPMFITQNLFDVNQMLHSLIGMDWGMSAQAMLKEYREWYSYYGSAMRRSVTEQAKESDGYFLAACLDHVSGSGSGGSGGPLTRRSEQEQLGQNSTVFDTPKSIKVGGKTSYDAMADWFFRSAPDEEKDKYVDGCLLRAGCTQVPCNPTCWHDNDLQGVADSCKEPEMSCGEVKAAYKEAKCCEKHGGKPEMPFKFPNDEPKGRKCGEVKAAYKEAKCCDNAEMPFKF